MGGVNQRSAPAASSITVNFPAAGTYPYEVDYAKGGDNNLTLTMTASSVPIPAVVPLTMTPNSVPSTTVDQAHQFAIAATDANGAALTSPTAITLIPDFTVPAPGLPIQIQRTYDSLVRSTSADFSYGWTLGVNIQTDISPTGDVTLTLNGRRRTFYFTPPANPVFVARY